MRLLIAEDERDLAEALSAFFEKNQFTVDTVYNGFDAYEYAVTGDYDAIVLDVMMPKLNGVEVLERLRAMLRRGGEYRPTVLTFGTRRSTAARVCSRARGRACA